MLSPLGLSEREAVGITPPCQRLTAGSKPISRSNRLHGYNRQNTGCSGLKKKEGKEQKRKNYKRNEQREKHFL